MNGKLNFLMMMCLVILSCSLAEGSSREVAVKLDGALRARQPLTVSYIGSLAAGGRQEFTLQLPRRESLELRVPFAEAPFNGTQLNARINGRRLAPYFAFGGDTRYDAVKGKPGMRPPLATIEGRWVIPARWLREGDNELILWTWTFALYSTSSPEIPAVVHAAREHWSMRNSTSLSISPRAGLFSALELIRAHQSERRSKAKASAKDGMDFFVYHGEC